MEFHMELKNKKAVTEATTTRKVNYSLVTPKNQGGILYVNLCTRRLYKCL